MGRRATRTMAAAIGVALAGALAGPAAAATRTVVVGQGFPGAGLGATSAEVVRAFGPPTARDPLQLTYDRGQREFIAFVLARGRVREVRAQTGSFCTPERVCTGRPGGVARIRAAYGRAVGRVYADDAQLRLGVLRTVRGRRTTTNFVVTSLAPTGRVVSIEIGRCPDMLGCGPPTRR